MRRLSLVASLSLALGSILALAIIPIGQGVDVSPLVWTLMTAEATNA